MTYDEKKSWLGRYRGARQKEQQLAAQYAEACEAAQHTTQSLSPVSGSSGDGQSLARAVERKEELERSVAAQHDLAIQIYGEILNALYGLSDDLNYVILHERYLECLTWEQIAHKTHLVLRWVYTRHKRAVEQLDL